MFAKSFLFLPRRDTTLQQSPVLVLPHSQACGALPTEAKNRHPITEKRAYELGALAACLKSPSVNMKLAADNMEDYSRNINGELAPLPWLDSHGADVPVGLGPQSLGAREAGRGNPYFPHLPARSFQMLVC
jgi:hypothetical protein